MDGKSKKSRNIKELRQLIGLNQEEFASLAGISAVYLSQIENARRPLTDDAAEAIASGISKIVSSDNIQFNIDPEELRIGHIASFYDENIQDRIIELLEDIEAKKYELSYIMEEGREPSEDIKRDYIYGMVGVPIESIIRKYRSAVEGNIEKLFAKSRKGEVQKATLPKSYYKRK